MIFMYNVYILCDWVDILLCYNSSSSVEHDHVNGFKVQWKHAVEYILYALY